MQQEASTAQTRPPVNLLMGTLDQTREADSQKPAVALRIVAGKPSEPGEALTVSERGELAECEGILERGLGTFFEVGHALLKIRDSRLYRTTHSSFERYCQERWNLGRSYACRVMGAAERLKLLPGDDRLPRPANEFQMRPFLKSAPEEFPGAWKRALNTAKEGKVTTRVVQAVIRELLPSEQDLVRAGKKGRRSKSKEKQPLAQVLLLLTEAKRQMTKGETDKALAALERIEGLLFGA